MKESRRVEMSYRDLVQVGALLRWCPTGRNDGRLRTMVHDELDEIGLSETEKQKGERDMQGVGNR